MFSESAVVRGPTAKPRQRAPFGDALNRLTGQRSAGQPQPYPPERSRHPILACSANGAWCHVLGNLLVGYPGIVC
jgi:hypothetical protein